MFPAHDIVAAKFLVILILDVLAKLSRPVFKLNKLSAESLAHLPKRAGIGESLAYELQLFKT